ncbi:MAG TPA: autotransporter outer membrane beta-barrel domain-containing protein [Bauldia sp.]|nr:autotransporter outer membrane beta-barrel domain-containing protein [Bauldia sp.]
MDFGELRNRARYGVLTPLALLGLLASGPALATDYTVPSGTTQGTTTLHAGDTLVVNGTINGAGDHAVDDDGSGDITSLINNGTLTTSGGAVGVISGYNITTFTNNGSINTPDFIGVILNGQFSDGSVSRPGPNFTNNGTITSYYGALAVEGDNTSTIINSGSMTSTAPGGAVMWITNGSVLNTGSMITAGGGIGIFTHSYFAGGLDVTNAGLIDVKNGTAIDFASIENETNDVNYGKPSIARNDALHLLTGSQIYGDVKFGLGLDKLDVSNFTSTTGLALAISFGQSLELDLPGSSLTLTTSSASQSQQIGDTVYAYQAGSSDTINGIANTRSGTFAVVSLPAATGGGGGTGGSGTTTASVTTEISNVVASQVGDITSSSFGTLDTGGATEAGGASGGENNVSNYVETRKPTPAEAAAARLAGLTATQGRKTWASGFGGISANQTGTPFLSGFGGLLAGTQASQSAATTLGVFGGYVRSGLNVNSGAQEVGTHTAVAGFYGETAGSHATLSYTVIGGVNFNHSDRNVAGDLAKADYLGWFVAPEGGISLPVVKSGGASLNLALKAKYIGGSIAGYTETGSIAPISMGAQPVSLAEGRIEVNGTRTIGTAANGPISFFGKAGVYAQSNLGGSAVPITIFGTTYTSTTPGTAKYGVYGGAGVKMPVSDAGDLSLSVNTSGQSDGLTNVTGKLQYLVQY